MSESQENIQMEVNENRTNASSTTTSSSSTATTSSSNNKLKLNKQNLLLI